MTTTNYSVVLDTEVLGKIKEIAKEQGITAAPIIRRILEQWVRLYGAQPWKDLRPPHYIDPNPPQNPTNPQNPSKNLFDTIP